MVRRLVEHEPVRAGRHQQREARARALARGEAARRARDRVAARGRTWPAASARPAAASRSARRTRRAARAAPSKPRRAWSSVPMRTPGPIQRVPAASGSRPRSPSTSVVFPLPLGPTSATRSPQASSRSSGPSTKLPRRSSRAVQAHGHVARALAAAEAQLQLPAPPRLLDGLEPLDRLLGRADLRRLLLGALGPLGAADLVGLVAGRGLGLAHAASPTTGAGCGARSARRSRSAA